MADKIKINSTTFREQPNYEAALDTLTIAIISNGRPLDKIETMIAEELARNYKGEFFFDEAWGSEPVFKTTVEQKGVTASVSFSFKHFSDPHNGSISIAASDYSCSLYDDASKLENWQNTSGVYSITSGDLKGSWVQIADTALESYIKNRTIRLVDDVLVGIFKHARKEFDTMMVFWQQNLDPVVIKKKTEDNLAYLQAQADKTRIRAQKNAEQRQAYMDMLTMPQSRINYPIVRELLERHLDGLVNEWHDPLWEQNHTKIIEFINVINRIQ